MAEAPGPNGGLRQVISQDTFSLTAAIGGRWGVAESVIPFTVFSVYYGFTEDLRVSIILAVVLSAVFAVRRLWRREPVGQALSGLFGVGIGAWLASRTGQAEDMFGYSIVKNAGFGLLYLVSIVVGWPLIGVMVGPLLGEEFAWRKNAARRRAYALATWFFVGMFAIRLMVQIPLYLAGQATALGLVNVPLGLPLFALVVWSSWVVIRRVPPVKVNEPVPES